MIGHQEIIDARLEGYEPTGVWIHLLDHEPTEFDRRDAEDSLQNSGRAQILIAPKERISGLRLVAVNGLTVHLNGTNTARMNQLLNRCMEFSPAQVFAVIDGELIVAEQANAEH